MLVNLPKFIRHEYAIRLWYADNKIKIRISMLKADISLSIFSRFSLIISFELYFSHLNKIITFIKIWMILHRIDVPKFELKPIGFFLDINPLHLLYLVHYILINASPIFYYSFKITTTKKESEKKPGPLWLSRKFVWVKGMHTKEHIWCRRNNASFGNILLL